MSLYPVNLQLSDRLCLVIGGGPVALRKTLSLLAGDARVRLVSPELIPELARIARSGAVEWLAREYVEGDLFGAFLAFAATDNRQAQKKIAAEASRYGVLLNSADDPQGSDFHVPAHFRRGRMLVTVSTGGGSPALAKVIRRRLEGEIVGEYAQVVELLGLIRSELQGSKESAEGHGRLFEALFAGGLIELVLAAQWFDLQVLLLEKLPPSIDAVALMKRFIEQCDG